jgi:phage tail-like protein
MIPSDLVNQYWLLSAINGWRIPPKGPALQGLAQGPDGRLALQTLPAQAEAFAPDVSGSVACPAALARDECGRTLILDARADRVVRIDPSGTIRVIAEFGGPGREPRRFRGPRGLALAGGSIVVADTGNHRVQVFSPPPYALIQLWGRADGTPGEGQGEFRWPWGVAADRRGDVYIADRGNGRIQKIARDGTWLAAMGAGVLTDPTELAVGPSGTVAVVDGAAGSGGGSVQLFVPAGTPPTALTRVDRPRAVAFDADENLYVGTAVGLIYHFAPDPSSPGGYAQVGAGVSGLDASAVHLIGAPGNRLIGIFQDTSSLARSLWTIPTDGSFVLSGQYVTDVLDSGIETCPWDRVTLLGTVPDGCSVQVEYFTSDDPDPGLVANPNDGPSYTFAGDSASLSCNNPACGDLTCQDPSCGGVADQALTCLVQAQPGRFLRLRLTFRSGGQSTPRLSAVQVFFPRRSYLQYLPAVYQQDEESRDFLDRFLSLFQATFDDFDARIDSMWRLFDPDSVPAQYFDWLAAWLDLPTDPTWALAKKRAMLKKAISSYRARGTVAGILQAIRDYAGVTDGLAIVEHFRLRAWPLLSAAGPLGGDVRLWSRQFYQRLQVGTFSQVGAFRLTDRPAPAAEPYDWGANEFSVFFPADPYDPDASTAKISAVVEREKPAHTQANLVPVLPRFRVGVQATVGVDTRVGGYTQLVLGSLSRLNYDAILAGSPAERDLDKLGASARPIIGVNTRLF